MVFITMKKIEVVAKFLTISVGSSLLILGVLQNVYYLEENRCDMTYMFEYPEYIPVHLDAGIKRKFPKYTLFLYGEGSYADELRNFGPSGIPVLFIPGNAGSHKQVRSVGSVALRKTEQLGFHFNFFTVDFQEELSGLKGSYLWSQTRFVHECIKVILQLYRSSNMGFHSLILIGHSMGGVIARGLFALQDFNRTSVSTIITLASPNMRPPIMVDHDMLKYYSQINTVWNSLNQTEQESMRHLVFVSIGGGNRDIQVHSSLIPFGESFLSSQSFSVIASAVPKVWLSTDHRCIVWCKQLVLAITRALIDMVDDKNNTIHNDVTRRISILRYHLLSSFSMSNSMTRAEMLISTNSEVNISHCKLFENKQYFQSSSRLGKKCFLLHITKDMDEVNVLYAGTLVDWIGGCESTKKCKFYSSFAKHTEIVPSKNGMGKVISIDERALDAENRVILLKLNDPREEKLYVKVNYKTNDTISVQSPWTTEHNNLHLVSQRTFFRLKLPFMKVPWFSYKMSVNTTCKEKYPSIVAKLQIPWLKEDKLIVFDRSLGLQLMSNWEPPAKYGCHLNSLPVLGVAFELFHHLPPATPPEIMPDVLFWFNSKCNFSIQVSFDLVGTAGQLLKFSYVNIIKWVAVFSLLDLVLEQSTFQSQWKLHAGFLCMLVLHSVYSVHVFCIEGLFLVIFTMLTAYSIHLLLIFLLSMGLGITKLFGDITSWISSLQRKQIKSNDCAERHSVSYYRFYGELTVFVGISLCTCGGIGLTVYMLTCICSGATLPRRRPKSLCLTLVQLLLQIPNMITWYKEIEEGYQIGFDASSSTCALFLIAMHFKNHYQENVRIDIILVYQGATFLFCLVALSPNVNICWIPQIMMLTIFLQCMSYR